jgi:aspartyl-tRNA(Asn)/glutamyl-tRNA(Gln) amidotransferase subunit C
MSISAEDVRHIAGLARLDLSDEEVERFRGELSKILEYVAQLDRVEATSAAEPEDPDQPPRPDRVEPWPDVAPLHAEAPDFDGGFFRVPRVVE